MDGPKHLFGRNTRTGVSKNVDGVFGPNVTHTQKEYKWAALCVREIWMMEPQCTTNMGCVNFSVTRLGDFLSFLGTIFLLKLPKHRATALAMVKSITI